MDPNYKDEFLSHMDQVRNKIANRKTRREIELEKQQNLGQYQGFIGQLDSSLNRQSTV